MDKLRQNERTFLEYCLNAAASVGGGFWGDGAWRAVRVPDSFLYTCVFDLTPEAGAEAALAAGLKAGVQAGTLPDHILFDGRNEALAGAMKAEGFAPVIAQTAMSMALSAQPARDARVTVIGPERVREWVDCLNAGMGVDPVPYYMYEALVQNPNIVLFGAEAEGKLAATLCLAMVGGVVCLHEIATLPEARGQGLASALCRAAMGEAWSRGFGEVWLQASDAGKPVYEKLGFTVDGILHHWKLV